MDEKARSAMGAAREIVEYCRSIAGCAGCMFDRGKNGCAFCEAPPCGWKLTEEEAVCKAQKSG